MNREIITQTSLDRSRIESSSLRRKIIETDNTDSFILNEDLSSDHLPTLSLMRKKAIKENLAKEEVGDELLNDDLNFQDIEKIKQFRIQKLKELEDSSKAEESKSKDDYINKLVKYIPTEVIAFYLTLTGILATDDSNYKDIYAYSLLTVGLLVTILYLKSFWKIKSNIQITLSCIAFLTWAISLDQVIDIPITLKALLLPIVTFVLPFIDPPIVQNEKTT